MAIEFADVLISLGSTLLAALLALAMRALHNWTKTLKSAFLRDAIDNAAGAIRTAVLEVEQTFVREAKDRNGDGKLSKDEAEKAAAMAASRAKALAGPEGLKLLAKELGVNLDDWFSSGVESAVAAKKIAEKK